MTRRRKQSGGVAVEFALVLPILVIILAGILELSWYISQFRVLTRVARDAARVGSVTIEGPNPTGADIEYEAEQQAITMLTQAGLPCSTDCNVTAIWSLDAVDGLYYVEVEVEYPYDSFTLSMPYLGPTMTSRFTMVTQQQ